MRISLLIKTLSQIPNSMHEGRCFKKSSWKKAFFIVKMSGPAMVWLASSDFWKAPSDLTVLFFNLKLFMTVSVLCGLQILSINNIICFYMCLFLIVVQHWQQGSNESWW